MRGVVVVLALLGGLVSCTGSSSSGPDRAPTRSDVRTLLDGFAAAVRDHDRRAYADALDPSPSAARFRARQLAAYPTLSRLPLGVWRYDVVGLIADASARAAAHRRYGAPPTLVHATLVYGLRGFDPLPDRHDLYLSVVERQGHAYLAGDDELRAQNLTSWQGPWEFGQLVAVAGARSIVLGPRGAPLRTVAAGVDGAVGAVSAVWGTAWSRRVVVVVAPSAAAFAALSGTGGERGVQAVAVTTGIDPVSRRPYGQRLLIDDAQVARLTAVGRRIVLTHETTHLATAVDTADITPRWLVEGFAEYVGNLGTGQPVRVAAAELAAEVHAGRVPTALPAAGAFTGAGAAAAYEQAWLACRLIAARAGQSGLVRFYRSIGRALSPSAEAVAAAFRSVLHETQTRFTAQWRAYLLGQLR